MFSSIVLAAGFGTRFLSSKPKIMHEIGGLPVLAHVLRVLHKSDNIFVVSNGNEDINKLASCYNASVCLQKDILGSADAVKSVPLDSISSEYTFVLYGDTPFISDNTISGVLELAAKEEASAVIIASEHEDANEYGKILVNVDGVITGISESGDTIGKSDVKTNLCNHGFLFKTQDLLKYLDSIKKNPIKGEYYLTDIIKIFYSNSLKAVQYTVDAKETIGINTRFDLIKAERIFQNRRRKEIISSGVTLMDPSTVYLSYDTNINMDVVIYPNVQILPGVTVESGATIYGNSILEGCNIERNAKIGPFARIRPGTIVGENSKIGNFVEVKNSEISKDTKINHLSYIGDSKVGSDVNIGAGTITCNYDGFKKHRTEIGDKTFIGSNTSLVAPIKIGAGALIGAGSTIVSNVDDNELAVTRCDRKSILNGAKRYRERKCAE